MTKMICRSEDTHYIDAYFFVGNQVKGHKVNYYTEKEAIQMYQRIINKYKGGTEQVFICLRTIEHDLVKSEKLNFKEP